MNLFLDGLFLTSINAVLKIYHDTKSQHILTFPRWVEDLHGRCKAAHEFYAMTARRIIHRRIAEVVLASKFLHAWYSNPAAWAALLRTFCTVQPAPYSIDGDGNGMNNTDEAYF